MEAVAVIEAQRPGLDTVIIWNDGHRLVAFAYENGRVKMTRPLDVATLDDGLLEVRDAFQINDAQLTRIHNWRDTTAVTERILANPRTRW